MRRQLAQRLSPYIPRNLIVRHTAPGELVLDQILFLPFKKKIQIQTDKHNKGKINIRNQIAQNRNGGLK
jgi:hypothetical protein